MNTSSFFTKLLPKHPDVTRAPNQTFSFAEDFGKAVRKLIQTKAITALGMVTPGSTTLQYLFDQMIHHDLSRVPTTIICDPSNKKGKFNLIKIEIAFFHLFPYIAPKRSFDPLLAHSQDLTEELLGETNGLKILEEPFIATLLPNFFVIYYGQKVPHGDTTTNKVKAKMIYLGMGYDLQARIVDNTLTTDKLDDFLMVADEAKKNLSLIQRYFLSSWDPVTLTQLALNNGPCRTITNVQSDDYPQAAHTIKIFFLSNLPALGFPQAMAVPGTFTFQLPGE
jgi:hypothetical protein